MDRTVDILAGLVAGGSVWFILSVIFPQYFVLVAIVAIVTTLVTFMVWRVGRRPRSTSVGKREMSTPTDVPENQLRPFNLDQYLLDRGVDRRHSMLGMVGPPSVGKTVLAGLISYELIERRNELEVD